MSFTKKNKSSDEEQMKEKRFVVQNSVEPFPDVR